jgi:hypothetical protein
VRERIPAQAAKHRYKMVEVAIASIVRATQRPSPGSFAPSGRLANALGLDIVEHCVQRFEVTVNITDQRAAHPGFRRQESWYRQKEHK